MAGRLSGSRVVVLLAEGSEPVHGKNGLELMAAIRRQGSRNLQDLEVVVLEAGGALTVSQHDHIHALLERLQRIEAAIAHGQGSGSAH